MQLKDQKSEPLPIENVPNPTDASEKILADQTITSSLKSPIAKQVEPPVSFPKKKFIRLRLLIGLPVSFVVGLGAIILVLPSFLDCSSKARQFQGRNDIGAIGRAQQAFYLKNNKFTNSIPELGIGISSENNNYKYVVQVDRQFVISYAQSKTRNTKNYLGVVFIGTSPKTQSITCEVDRKQSLASIIPSYQNGTVSCPQGSISLGY